MQSKFMAAIYLLYFELFGDNLERKRIERHEFRSRVSTRRRDKLINSLVREREGIEERRVRDENRQHSKERIRG